jgi:hypothetical protein
MALVTSNESVRKRTKSDAAHVHNGEVAMKIRITQDVPKYARLTTGLVVSAEPVASHPELMRVKDFGAFENGALVRGWELVLPDE